jgi:hypothetical protein
MGYAGQYPMEVPSVYGCKLFRHRQQLCSPRQFLN